MKRTFSFFLFLFLLNLNTSHAFNCDVGPDVGNLNDLLKVVADEPEYDQLFCKGLDSCQTSGDGSGVVPETPSDCSTASSMFAQGDSIIKSRNYGNCGLSKAELAALTYYTGSGYSCINRSLRNKTGNKAVNKVVEVLNKALSKLPSYKGIVRRGASLPQEIRDQHKEGKIVTYDAFTSSSTRSGFDGQDIFHIFSKTGKPIMGFSSYDNEYEILFKSGANFKVLKTEVVNGINYYVMKEVDTSKSVAAQAAEDKKTLELYLAIKNKTAQGYDADKWACPLVTPTTLEKTIDQKLLPSL